MVHNAEFSGYVRNKSRITRLSSCKIESKFSKHSVLFTSTFLVILNEGVELDVESLVSTSVNYHYRVASLVLLLPGVGEVEHVVRGNFKPSYFTGVVRIPVNKSIASDSLFVEFVDEMIVLYSFNGIEFHWKVWNNSIVLRYQEIMKHSALNERDLSAGHLLPVLVEDSEVCPRPF